jgi:hypothetical protein
MLSHSRRRRLFDDRGKAQERNEGVVRTTAGKIREKGVQKKEHARHDLALQRMEEGEFLNRGKAVCA